MRTEKIMVRCAIMLAAVGICSTAFAKIGVVEINFGTYDVSNPPAGTQLRLFEDKGPLNVWNNIGTMAGTETSAVDGGNLVYRTGSSTESGFSITWDSDGIDTHDGYGVGDIDDGHDELFYTYLVGSFGNNSITLSSSGISNLFTGDTDSLYDLYLYIDGDDTFGGKFTAADAGSGTSYYGEDPVGTDFGAANDGTDPLSHYYQVTSTTPGSPTSPGNYVLFQGLSSDFNLTISSSDALTALNGIEIHVTPEPATFGLFALMAVAGLGIRRRRRA